MGAGHPWAGLLLGAALLLPPPGTGSRERGFCARWLDLGVADREACLLEAERREGEAGWDPRCRARLRGGVRHALTAECRRRRLMREFEVRALVDRILEPCLRAEQETGKGPDG